MSVFNPLVKIGSYIKFGEDGKEIIGQVVSLGTGNCVIVEPWTGVATHTAIPHSSIEINMRKFGFSEFKPFEVISTSDAMAELIELANDPIVKKGQYIGHGNELYIVAATVNGHLLLVDMKKGNRWGNAVEASNNQIRLSGLVHELSLDDFRIISLVEAVQMLGQGVL